MLKMYLNELHRLLTKSNYVLLMIVLPFVMFFILAGIYTKGSVRDLPIMVVDLDHSSLSRTLIRSFDAAQGLKVTDIRDNIPNVEEEILKGSAYAVIIIPKNLEADVKKGKQATVTAYKNSANLILSNVMLTDISTVIKTISAGVVLQKLQIKGIDRAIGLNIVSALNLKTSILFNPYYNYSVFMVAPICMAVFQMIVLIVAALSAYDSFSNDGLTHPEEFDKLHVVRSVFGKYFAHFTIYTVCIPLLYALYGLCFGITLQNIWVTYFFILVFLSAIYFLGSLLGLWVKNRFFSVEIAIFLTTPGFLFAGYTFPLYAMPSFIAAIGRIFPFTVFIQGFLKISFMDAPYAAFKPEVVIISTIAMVSLLTYLGSLYYFIKKLRSSYANAV